MMLDRTVAPAASAVDRPKLPASESLTIQGVTVTSLSQGEQPVMLLEFVIPIGRWQEPAPGIAYFVSKMLTEGTRSKSSAEIASIFDFYGSHLDIIPTLDHISIKLYTLNKFLPNLLPLVVELFNESNFSEKEFDTLKQIRLQQIRQQHARNNAYASLKFREMLFGKNHPYGHIILPDEVEKTTLETVANFKNAILTKPQIFVSGLISSSEMAAIEEMLSQLSFTAPMAPADAIISPTKSQTITREDSSQASIRMGNIAVSRQHPDSHKLKIANTMLGGFFGSRLMKNIREEKGLTYGIHSSFVHMEQGSYWNIGSEVLRDKTELAKEEILKEILKLSNEAPGQAEFNMVKNYLKGKFLSSFDSPFSSHEMIKSLRLENLPDQYLMDFLDELDGMKAEEVSEMVGKHFSNDLTTLMVF